MCKILPKNLFSLFLSLLLVCCSLLVSINIARAMQREVPGTWSGTTRVAANVRSGPGRTAPIVGDLAAQTQVTVYATVRGEMVWPGIDGWYVISSPGDALRYVYAGLVTRTSPQEDGAVASATQKRIVVSLSRQWLYAFEDGRQVRDIAVTTGQPGMETPTGTYHVFSKLTATTFYPPVPAGSSSYYAPTYINYALGFREGGYFIHDATWRSDFGPHTNTWHHDHTYGWETGSHGCVNLPLRAMSWLYQWAGIGTTVQIVL